jgi:hypothetical protein
MTYVKITPEIKERVAELIGTICTYAEAAGAVGIGTTSVDKIMADPEYRKKADDIRSARDSAASTFAAIVRGMMTATNADGTPDQAQRRTGAELYGKYPGLVDTDEAGASSDSMLPGVVLLFPSEYILDENALVVFSLKELAPVPDTTEV